jgi:glucose-6-phosphate isomerase
MHSCGSSALHRRSSLGSVDTDTITRLKALAGELTPIRFLCNSSARTDQLTFDAVGLRADFSRQPISGEMWSLLLGLAADTGIREKFGQMFAGAEMNPTEHRAVLHTALRADPSSSQHAAWARVQLDKALDCARRVRADRSVKAVVNIGIGGSHLGPKMVTRALRRFHDGPVVRFVSNIDAADFDAAVADLDPASTVFVVSSKTFTTSETMHNASRAKNWLQLGGVPWNARFYAATAAPARAIDDGFLPENCLEFAEWVGGRFSVSSVIGFPVMCAVGPELFLEMLDGMREMDIHASTAAYEENLAVAHALVWFANLAVHGFPSVAVVPYSTDCELLPSFLQQLVMESNGKEIDVDNNYLSGPAAPIVWGSPGTDAQHAYFQFLHQSHSGAPVEFIGTVEPLGNDPVAHDILVANMLAQSEALAVGSPNSMPERSFPGNRGSSVIFLERLDPRCLGALIAMYEHSTVVQGWLHGVNSFDQFGVELGKTLAFEFNEEIRALENQKAQSHAALVRSGETLTHPLLKWYAKRRKNI